PKDDRMTTDVAATKVLTDLADMNGVSAGVRVYNGDEVVQAQARSAKGSSGSVEFGVEDNYSGGEFDVPSITLDPADLLEFLEE
ncbi:MAG: hypothetical protein MRY79_09250, partial [Alphaproteobacteria bacterium]|nr:hypothetical protein [Alphaproteobacteria bacterium]